MGSTRLPGKVLMNLGAVPAMEILIARLSLVRTLDQIVVATTTSSQDDAIVNFCKSNDIAFFRGSEENVYQRVLDCAIANSAEIIVEITADCPIIDPRIVDLAIQTYLDNPLSEYVGNNVVETFPNGMDVQVFSLSALGKCSQFVMTAEDLEHVSLFFKRQPQLFNSIALSAPEHQRRPEISLTLDEIEDFHLLENIVNHFASDLMNFSLDDVLNYLDENPYLLRINAEVVRKAVPN